MPQSGRPTPGDMTGREKARQNKEQQVAQQERAQEMSMSDAAQSEDEQHGIFDAQSGQMVDDDNDRNAVTVVDDTTERRTGLFQPREQEPVLTGQETPEEIAPLLAERKAFTRAPQPVERARKTHVIIRVDADIDDMTYGMVNGLPNNFTFKEGLQYRVPIDVAEHLNDRDLVRQWVG